MLVWSIAALGLAPGLFWLWHFYRRDRLEPEPKALIVEVFLIGMAVAAPVLLLEAPLERVALWPVIVLGPVIEELAKFLVVRRGIYRNREFDEPMDGIVYAAAAALGFASIENVGYMWLAFARGILAPAFIGRALLVVPGHALWSSLWGAALGRAKFAPGETGRPWVRRSLAVAIGLHALYNVLLYVSPLAAVPVLVLTAATWVMVNRRIAEALRGSPFIDPRSVVTPGSVGHFDGPDLAAGEAPVDEHHRL